MKVRIALTLDVDKAAFERERWSGAAPASDADVRRAIQTDAIDAVIDRLGAPWTFLVSGPEVAERRAEARARCNW